MHITLKLLGVLFKKLCGVGKRFYPKIFLIVVLTIDWITIITRFFFFINSIKWKRNFQKWHFLPQNLYFSFKILIFQFNIKHRSFKFKLNCKCFYNTLLNRDTLGFSKFDWKKTFFWAWKKVGMLLQIALNLVPNHWFYPNFPILLPI